MSSGTDPPPGRADPTKASSSMSTTSAATMDGAMEGMRRLGEGLADAFNRAAAAVAGSVARGELGGHATVDLHRYVELQERVAELQGLQIEAQLAHTRRSEASLQRRLAVLRQLEGEARRAMERADAQYEKHGMGKWYPGKVLLQDQGKRLAASHAAAEQASDLLRRRKGQVEHLSANLKAMQQRIETWEAKAGELSVAQAEVQVLEERMFGAGGGEAGPEGALSPQEVVDTLCAMERPDSEAEGTEGSGEGEEPGAEAEDKGKVDKFGCWGRGRLLRLVASKLGPPKPGAPDKYGALGRGRLLRITASRITRVARGDACVVEVAGADELELHVEGQSFKLEEGKEEEEEEEEEQAPAAAPEAKIGEGGLLRKIADKLGRPEKDEFGALGRGRMLRIAADKMQRAAAARRAERQAAVRRVAGGIGAHADQEPALDAEELRELFPPWATNFNPALHCPPSTFLWTYPNRFMGRLKKLRTGDVQHAYYRFGPFGSDPEQASALTRLATAMSGLPELLPERSPGGEAGGRLPLLMLSGLGSTMVSWGVPLMRALSVDHEVIIMDYRGSGLSRVLSQDDPWDYFKQAEAVLMLADALGIPKFNWVGWSSGGNVGLVLAALHGCRLGRMVSHAGVAGGSNTIAPPTLRFLDPDAKVSLGQTMALIFPPREPKQFRATCAQYIKEVFSMPKSIVDAEPSKKALREQWAADVAFLAGEEHVWDALPRVEVPCLITGGTDDVLVPRENAERLAARIPGARLHLFDGWGHGWQDSAHFASVLNEFLCAGGGGLEGAGSAMPGWGLSGEVSLGPSASGTLQ